MPLTLDQLDHLLLTWEERLHRIDDSLLALEADPAYQTLIGPGERNRYDGISARKLRDVQQELTSLFADQATLREIIDQARSLRSTLRGRIWGKDDQLTAIEGLLLGPSISRSPAPPPLEQRSLLAQVPYARSVTPETLLQEMVQRFEHARDALLAVWHAWQAIEPAVLRAEERLRSIDESVAHMGLTPSSVEGLVGLRAEISRLRTKVARDPLGATTDLDGRLAPRFQLVEGVLASLKARQRKVEEQLLRSRESLTTLEQRYAALQALWKEAREQIELGPAAARIPTIGQELASLAAALEELNAPGGWSNREAIERWVSRREKLQEQIQRLDRQARTLLTARQEVTGRFAEKSARIESLRGRGVVIPEQVTSCLHRLEELLAQRPLPVGRAASLLDLLDQAVMLVVLFWLPLLVSCRRIDVPTEELFVVNKAVVPGLTDPTKKKGTAILNGHLGDVFLAQSSMGHADWQGTVEGQTMERHGELLLVKRSPRDGMAFLFTEDLTARVPVPTSAWICSNAPKPIQLSFMPCQEVLHRIVLSPKMTAAYPPCTGGPCQLGLVHEDKATWIEVENLLSVEQRFLGKVQVLVVSRNQNQPEANGLGLIVFRAAPGLPEMLRVPMDVLDRTDPARLRYRTTRPSFQEEALVLEGTEREMDAATNQELVSRPIREVYRLDGKTLKRQ
ncbi:MAG: hypothetical protein RMJ98_20420 [Myxococcales bacterium]|nr:hypothetical protein [Polyangiaceae bacterium]MDW8251667.1 hypothetical protein [Myxococcales bacterium]